MNKSLGLLACYLKKKRKEKREKWKVDKKRLKGALSSMSYMVTRG